MPHEKRRTVQSRRHTSWEENPSEEWAFALEHIDQGELDYAVGHCERAIEIWPSYYDAWLLLGGVLEEKGEYVAALDAVEKASEIAVMELSQAWNNLASLYLIRQQWEAALTIDRVLTLIDPSRHAIVCYRMAIAYTQLGDVESGMRWMQDAISGRADLLDRALDESWLTALHPRLETMQATQQSGKQKADLSAE